MLIRAAAAVFMRDIKYVATSFGSPFSCCMINSMGVFRHVVLGCTPPNDHTIEMPHIFTRQIWPKDANCNDTKDFPQRPSGPDSRVLSGSRCLVPYCIVSSFLKDQRYDLVFWPLEHLSISASISKLECICMLSRTPSLLGSSTPFFAPK